MSSFSDLTGGVLKTGQYLWDTNALAWVKATGGGVGSSVSVTNFPASFGASQVGTWSVGVNNFPITQPVSGTVAVSNMVAQGLTDTQLRATPVPVSGTFYQGTQPVSIAAMPSTPVTGTFWQATQPVSGTFYQATQPVSGTFWQGTQPISAVSLPLPTNAAISANQVIPGTTGSPSTSVATVQGNASGVPIPVSGSFYQATQPVSGTFWQAIQPVAIDQTTIGTTNATAPKAQFLNTATAAPNNSYMPLQVDQYGNLLATVDGPAMSRQTELLQQILLELQVISFQNAIAFNLSNSPDNIRNSLI